MKKNLLWMFAVVAIFVVVSCQKEKEIVPNEEEIEVTPPAIDDDAIPTVITGTILDDATKTAYAEDGKFTWVSSDQVRLLTCESLETYSRIGFYTYRIKEGGLTNDNKSAVFTSLGTAGDLIDFVDGTWKSTGIAMYPTSALDRFNTPEAHAYGTPWFTLARGNVSGAKSDILLTGVKVDAINNFKFSTAMAVLKITLRNIPANAAAIKLCTSDKTNYPVDGDFALSRNGDLVDMTFLPDWVSSFNGYQKVDISAEGEISEKTLYFNIPAAEYPADKLSLLVEDANGGMIMKRIIGAKMNIERNECLELPALTIASDCEIGGDVRTPRVVWSIDSKQLRFAVNKNSSLSLSEFPDGYRFTNNNETRYASSTSGFPVGYSISALTPNPLSSGSGAYYLHYVILSDTTKPTDVTDANVVKYGTIPFYYSSGDVESTYAGEYDFSGMSGYTHIQAREDNPDNGRLCHPGTESGYNTKMTLAATDDFTRGNIMLTKLYNQSPSSGHQLYGYLDAANSKIIIPYPGDEKDNCFFVSWNSNYFYIASCETVTFSDSVLSSTATNNLEFIISDGTLTHSDYLMMKYTNTSYSFTTFDAFVYGKGLVFEK